MWSRFLLKVVLLVLVVVGTVQLISAQVRLDKNQRQLAALQEEKEQLVLNNEELTALLDDGSYDALIERALRENGYVRSDERVYTDVTGN